jgi:hypothetical protein
MRIATALAAPVAALALAAPAHASPETSVDCSPAPTCSILEQAITGNIAATAVKNWADIPHKAVENWATKLNPHQIANNYANAIHDGIRNWTGVSVGTDPNPDN